MTVRVPNPVEYRQLNLGLFPVPVIDGLDMYASRADLSRAQLARRIMTGWLTAQLEADGSFDFAALNRAEAMESALGE